MENVKNLESKHLETLMVKNKIASDDENQIKSSSMPLLNKELTKNYNLEVNDQMFCQPLEAS